MIRQITDSICENLTDSDLESTKTQISKLFVNEPYIVLCYHYYIKYIITNYVLLYFYNCFIYLYYKNWNIPYYDLFATAWVVEFMIFICKLNLAPRTMQFITCTTCWHKTAYSSGTIKTCCATGSRLGPTVCQIWAWRADDNNCSEAYFVYKVD